MQYYPAKWTEESRVNFVMARTGCNEETAKEYLIAEEGDQYAAVAWYHADRKVI